MENNSVGPAKSTETELSYAAAYYRKNREKILASRRARYASDPEYRRKEKDRNLIHYWTDAKYRQKQSFQKHLHTRERNNTIQSRLYRRWYYVERHKTGEPWETYKKRMLRLIAVLVSSGMTTSSKSCYDSLRLTN